MTKIFCCSISWACGNQLCKSVTSNGNWMQSYLCSETFWLLHYLNGELLPLFDINWLLTWNVSIQILEFEIELLQTPSNCRFSNTGRFKWVRDNICNDDTKHFSLVMMNLSQKSTKSKNRLNAALSCITTSLLVGWSDLTELLCCTKSWIIVAN